MTYEVQVSSGGDRISVFQIEYVKEIFITEDTYTLYGEDDRILFSSPLSNVVYVREI